MDNINLLPVLASLDRYERSLLMRTRSERSSGSFRYSDGGAFLVLPQDLSINIRKMDDINLLPVLASLDRYERSLLMRTRSERSSGSFRYSDGGASLVLPQDLSIYENKIISQCRRHTHDGTQK